MFLFILAQVPHLVDAEEILQETNLVIWRKSHTFQAGTNFYGWCCRIAVLEVLKHRERHRRSAVPLSDEFLEVIAREAAGERRTAGRTPPSASGLPGAAGSGRP